LILQNHSIRTLIVCGVSTEASVSTTVREANDRGCECIIPADVAFAAIGVMQSGPSSGAECLAGFLHGIRTLEKVAQEEMS